MKKILVAILALMMAMPMAAQAKVTCTSQFGNCTQVSCTGSSCTSSAAKPSSTVKPSSTAKPVSGTSMSSMAAQVVAETNADRAKAGLTQLRVDADLTAAACVRAKEIVSKFSHTRPNGSRGITASGKAVGENIAKGQQSAAKVMAAWMSSSGHRATILRPSLRSVGVCAYQVNGIMYWVQLFGK